MKYVFVKKDAFRAELKNPERAAHIWIDKEKGANNLSGGSVDIPAGSELPYHAHEKEEEMMFIYEGRGTAVIEGESFPLEPETMVFVPPGIKHTFKNTGKGPLRFTFFYAPPGPEQNIRILASKK
jgi:mannose-6-phosphate isomerase-like protein (cupin superfamily)